MSFGEGRHPIQTTNVNVEGEQVVDVVERGASSGPKGQVDGRCWRWRRPSPVQFPRERVGDGGGRAPRVKLGGGGQAPRVKLDEGAEPRAITW